MARRLQRAAGEKRPHCANEEAQRAEAGIPVGGRQVQHRPLRRHDVAGHRRDAEEDAAEQVHAGLPPASAAARRQPAVARRCSIRDRAGYEEADRAEGVRPPNQAVVVRIGQLGVQRLVGGDVEEQRARRLDDRGPPSRPACTWRTACREREPALERPTGREENRPDEERDPIRLRSDEVQIARERPDEEARRAQREAERHPALAADHAAARRLTCRCSTSVSEPPSMIIVTFTARTSRPFSPFDSSPMPVATPRYAAAGIVVIEIATPTAALARVSKARIPATPATNATTTVDALTVKRLSKLVPPILKPPGSRPKTLRIAVIRPATRQPNPSPIASVPKLRLASRQLRSTSPVQVAVIGSMSGLTAIAPTIRISLL